MPPPLTARPKNVTSVWVRHWPLLSLVVLCVLLELAGTPARMLLRYDRAAVLQGEWWRFLTGNFVHLGWGHLLEDMLGALLLWLLFEPFLPGWRLPLTVTMGALGVGIGLFLGSPDVHWYVGISGALDTLWALGAMLMIRERDRFGWLLGGFLVLKLAYEQIFGPLPFSTLSTGGAVVVDAHLYGALTGALMGFIWVVCGAHRIMRASKDPETAR